jgi:polysaccharide export outer membrane protein
MVQKYEPKICIDDALVIYVTSSHPNTVATFTPPPFGYYTQNEATASITTTPQTLYTYLVDENGEINFPVLGRLHVAGMSVNETSRMLENLIQKQAPGALVNVQITNFKVSIFGEVMNPNQFTITTPRVSILDLIAMSGGVTVTADRNNVWLVRDNNGEKVHVKFDLTDPALFASPYYYLQQNDVVFIQPNKAQKRNSTSSTGDVVKVQIFSVIISGISAFFTALLLYNGTNSGTNSGTN